MLIVGSRGSFCTGTALAPGLVLTAAHCVLPGADYKLVEFDAVRQPAFRDVATIRRHPQFALQALLGHRATADMALLQLAAPLPAASARDSFWATHAPPSANRSSLSAPASRFAVTDRPAAPRVRRRSSATGRPGNLQIRLVDPATNGDARRAGRLHRRFRRTGLS